MSLSEENVHYRRLADYEQVVLPQYLRLKNVDWQLMRGLILKRWQQVNAVLIRDFFKRQQALGYLSCRHLLSKFNPNPRGGYPSRLIYLPHDFLPVSHYCPLAYDRTRRALPGTTTRGRRDERALAEAETYYRYNNSFARHFAEFGYFSDQPVKAWGREEMEAAWLRRAPDKRAFMAEHLNTVARFLSRDKCLAIMLEAGAPRLWQLSGEKELLGYVAYFLDCWQRFHKYEQAAPVATPLADAGAATAGPAVADRWEGLLINYTLADLNTLLVFAGLLETAEPLAIAAGIKPRHWVAVAAALYKRNKTRADRAALHRAFADTYGPAVGSLSSFSREYNESNEAAQQCYSRALSRLG